MASTKELRAQVGPAVYEAFERIARGLNFETLEDRNSDSLDFRGVGVGCLRDALQTAFELGQRHANTLDSTDPSCP